MLNIVIGVALGLVFLLAALHLAGLQMAQTHVAEGVREVAGLPEGVAARVRDVASHPRWRLSVKKIDILSDQGGVLRYRETGSNGAITFAIRELEKDHSFESVIDDMTQPFGGRWLITLARAGDKTRVTIREEGFVKPPIFRVLSKYVFGHEATLTAYLKDLETAQRR